MVRVGWGKCGGRTGMGVGGVGNAVGKVGEESHLLHSLILRRMG